MKPKLNKPHVAAISGLTETDVEYVGQNIDDRWNGRGTDAYKNIRLPILITDEIVDLERDGEDYSQSRRR